MSVPLRSVLPLLLALLTLLPLPSEGAAKPGKEELARIFAKSQTSTLEYTQTWTMDGVGTTTVTTWMKNGKVCTRTLHKGQESRALFLGDATYVWNAPKKKWQKVTDPSQLPEGPEAGDSDPDEFDRATFLGREKAGGLSCLKYQAQDPDTGTVTFWISEDYGITVRMKGQGISLETTSVKAGPIPDGVFSPR